MKKEALLRAIVVCVIAGLAFWFALRESAKEPAASTAKPAEALTMKALKSEPIPRAELETAKIAGAQAQVPEACTALWDRTATVSQVQLYEDLKRGVLRFDPQCLSFETPTDLVKKVYTACAFDQSSGKLTNESDCLANFGIYRSYSIDRLTPDQKDYRSMSMALLANKILARFSLNNQRAEGRAELREMVNAMIEREPGFFEARKALVAVEMGSIGTPEHTPEVLRAAVDGALRLNPTDPQLTEAYLLNEQEAGNSAAVSDFVERNPDSGLGYYYRAWDAWKKGDHENALADLQQAARLLPSDARVAKTLGDAEAGKKDSVFNMSVGFTFGDL